MPPTSRRRAAPTPRRAAPRGDLGVRDGHDGAARAPPEQLREEDGSVAGRAATDVVGDVDEDDRPLAARARARPPSPGRSRTTVNSSRRPLGVRCQLCRAGARGLLRAVLERDDDAEAGALHVAVREAGKQRDAQDAVAGGEVSAFARRSRNGL